MTKIVVSFAKHGSDKQMYISVHAVTICNLSLGLDPQFY